MDETKRKLKQTWYSMVRRCHKPSPSEYKSGTVYQYHLRGISVCEEWRYDFDAFYEWAVLNGYQPGLTIDRIDPDGDYCPSNCRWITKRENSMRARRNKVSDEYSEKHKKGLGRYYTVIHWCGTSFGIVDKVHITYHDTLLRQRDLRRKLGRGRILLCRVHTKETMDLKENAMVPHRPGSR